jgi:hypothetical protein
MTEISTAADAQVQLALAARPPARAPTPPASHPHHRPPAATLKGGLADPFAR